MAQAHIKIVLDQLQCVTTSFGFGKDDTYILTFVTDPTVTPPKLLGSSIAGIWQMGNGDIVKDQTLIDLSPNPAPDGVEWIVMVYEKFLFGLDQSQLEKAIEIAQQALNAAHQVQVQLGQPSSGNWTSMLVDTVINTLVKIFTRWGRDAHLGQNQQKILPPAIGSYPYTFVCTEDSSDYNVKYTVTLS